MILYQETGDAEGAQEAFDRALAIARREADPALEMRTLAAATDVDWYHLRFPEVLDKGQRAIELAHRVDDLRAEVRARYYTALTMHSMGDHEGMRVHALAVLTLATRLRDRSRLANALWVEQAWFAVGGTGQPLATSPSAV